MVRIRPVTVWAESASAHPKRNLVANTPDNGRRRAAEEDGKGVFPMEPLQERLNHNRTREEDPLVRGDWIQREKACPLCGSTKTWEYTGNGRNCLSGNHVCCTCGHMWEEADR